MSAQRMFYAVARGRATGVFGSWPEAERLVSGFAGARFKKFKSQSEAAAFAREPRARHARFVHDEAEAYCVQAAAGHRGRLHGRRLPRQPERRQ